MCVRVCVRACVCVCVKEIDGMVSDGQTNLKAAKRILSNRFITQLILANSFKLQLKLGKNINMAIL